MYIETVDANTVAGIFELYDTKAIVLKYKKDAFKDLVSHIVEVRYFTESYIDGNGRQKRDLIGFVKMFPKTLFTEDFPLLKTFLEKYNITGKYLVIKEHIAELEKELNPDEWEAIENARKLKEQHDEIEKLEIQRMKAVHEPKHIDRQIEVTGSELINFHHFRTSEIDEKTGNPVGTKLILTYARYLTDDEIITSKKKPNGLNRPLTKCGVVPKLEYIYAYKKDLTTVVNEWLTVNNLRSLADIVFAKIDELEHMPNPVISDVGGENGTQEK